MRVAVLCVVLSFLTLAYSQVPPPCLSPPLWSGRVFVRDRARGFSVTAKFYYDAAKQRTAIIEEIDSSGGGQEFFYVINIYQDKVQYQINLDTEECVVNDLTDKFQPVQIPLNATFISEFYLGSSSANDTGVLVEAWTGTTTNPNGRYEILVTDKGCIPVNDIFVNFDDPQVVEFFYYDIVLGDPDPDVFIPPPQCRQ